MVFGIDEDFTCPICNRRHTSEKMSWHHLKPKCGDSERDEPRIYICKTCHSVIHYCHSNEELRIQFNSLEKIFQSSRIMNMVNLYKYDKHNKTITIKKLKQLKKCA